MVAVKLSEATGVKMAHVEKRLPKLKEYIVLFKKNDIQITPTPVDKEKWDDEYKHLVCGVSKQELEKLKDIMESEFTTEDDILEADAICCKIALNPIEVLYNECKAITEEEKLNAKYNNAWRIVRDVATTGGAKNIADKKKLEITAPFFIIMTPQKKKYLIKRDYNDESEQPRIKMLFADTYLTSNPGDFWQDIKTTGLDNEGWVDFKNGKKPLKMIDRMLKSVTSKDDIILDFFSGSATTAHAVLELNKEDRGKRKFIMVQLPEPCGQNSEFINVAEIGKERIRRVIKKLNEEQAGKLDLGGTSAQDRGFKVLKLDKSNFKQWQQLAPDATTEQIEKQLSLHIDHISKKATPEDLLFEILIKAGFMPTEKVQTITLAGIPVFSIADGGLLICLADTVTKELINAVAEAEPMQFICLDKAFGGNDQLKANAVQTFNARNMGKEKHNQIIFRTV